VVFPDRVVLDFRFRAIQLNRLNWRDFARRENPAASALMARMKIAPDDRARVKLECVRLLSTLRLNEAKMHLILGFVDTYLRLNDDEQKIYQTELEKLAPVEKEQIVEATMSWAERAEQKGLQKGLQQGLQQGMLTLVTKQIEHRFGLIDSQTRERLSELSSDQLETLGDALLDFSRPEDLAEWLQSP